MSCVLPRLEAIFLAIEEGRGEVQVPLAMHADESECFFDHVLDHAEEDVESAAADPPMVAGRYELAIANALAISGLTDVALSYELVMLSESREAYELYVRGDEGFLHVCYSTLFPFERNFPAIAGCHTLTIRSTCPRYTGVLVGGDVRDAEAMYDQNSGVFELPPHTATFTAPQSVWRGPPPLNAVFENHYFSVADLARAMHSLPDSWRRLEQNHGLVAFDNDDDGHLSFGRFTIEGERPLEFSRVFLQGPSPLKIVSMEDGHGVLEVGWALVSEGCSVRCTEPGLEGWRFGAGFCDVSEMTPQDVIDDWDRRYDSDEEENREPSALAKLRRDCVDGERPPPEQTIA